MPDQVMTEQAMTEQTMHFTPDGGASMFNKIANKYDVLNACMSFGMDRLWRRALVKELLRNDAHVILDVASGTADVAMRIAGGNPTACVIGLDPSAGMLDVGREKISKKGLDDRINLCEGDAQAMPFVEDFFDSSGIAFGIRNVPNRAKGLAEMVRVTRPGGTVAVLELGEPDLTLFAPFARFHVHNVVPILGRYSAGKEAYGYLQKSIADFPPRDEFLATMAAAGLTNLTCRPFAFGGANLFVGTVAAV